MLPAGAMVTSGPKLLPRIICRFMILSHLGYVLTSVA